jgi:formiminoglutamase
MSISFIPLSKEKTKEIVSMRAGETKIGENVHFEHPAPQNKYAIIGIEESIGPLANYGISGSERGFQSFLKRFLNMQSNRFVSGNEIYLHGIITCNIPFETSLQARKVVEELDIIVEKEISIILNKGLIPIVIGGGHNNAFPIIKAVSYHVQKPIDVVNLDPHADCRPLEGRHSGNSFSYAIQEGILANYSVIGLHKAYNSTSILHFLAENKCFHSFFDDYIMNPDQFAKDVQHVKKNIDPNTSFGVEVDMDCMRLMPSSAFTPSGFSVEQVRYFIQSISSHSSCSYLHLPEAAPTNEAEEKVTGKTLAYLVWDFITTNS